MRFIKKYNEAIFNRDYTPKEKTFVDTFSKWYIPGNEDEIYTVLGAGDKYITYVSDDDVKGMVLNRYFDFNNPKLNKLHDTISNFVKNFVKVEEPQPEEPRKQVYADDIDVELNFDEAIYLGGEKAIIAAYFIAGEDDNYLDVINVKELASQTATFADATPYSVTIHYTKIPKNKIEILDTVDGKEGFSFIKLPYWLYKENPDLTIKRCKLPRKRLNLRDASLGNEELMSKFKDPNVEKYFRGSNPDERTLQLINIYKKGAK